jgi:conjugative transfer pilus assembly protein TraH
MMKNKLLICIIIMMLPVHCLADAWVDNWIQQSTVSGPGSFASESRGYVYGGRFSARYNQEVDHPISIQPPSFKKGCGGIDIFLGSVSYLEVDRLVEKFESIMSGALATYAFDIALNILCTQCRKNCNRLRLLWIV